MRKILILSAAAASLFAMPAAAQIAGGLTGQLGAGASVGLPQAGPILGQAGDTVRGAGDLTRDTLRDGRDAVRGATPDASVGARARAEASADARGANAGLDLDAGARVTSADGATLGSVVGVVRDTAGRVQSFAVRSADGVIRSVPADAASVRAGAVVTGWSEAEFQGRQPD